MGQKRTPARPRDMNELAARIGAIATGEIEDDSRPVDAAAVKRGKARAAKLTPARRKQIAKKAAAVRWGRGKP
jgi:hypothetical protein